jgi:NAD(P)-dependent dehydrogenase (short-subunit alcohol dehydrogenase family)
MKFSTGNSRTWLITGASSGIGNALATALLERGERVTVTARSRADVSRFEERYRGRVLATELDVTDAEQAGAAARRTVDSFDRLDVVVNNAGYGLFGPLEELNPDDVRALFETNVFGALHMIQAALPQMRRQRSGHIVQISSLEGIAPLLAGETAYAASKFAVEGLCEALTREVAHFGVRTTIVEPGPVRTGFAAHASAQAPEIGDYDSSVGEALDTFERLADNQPNDPSRVAAAIIRAVESSDPPLRLTLGGEAVQAARKKLSRQLDELNAWAALGQSTRISA